MADRNFKPDSGNDLVLEDAGSTDRLRITDGGSTILYDEGGDAALTIPTSGVPDFPNGLTLSSNVIAGDVTGVTFDDYEEGTWTTTISNLTSCANITLSEATYTKIGRIVILIAKFALDFSASSTLTQFAFTIPFSLMSNTHPPSGAVDGYDGSTNILGDVSDFTSSNATQLRMIFPTSSVSAGATSGGWGIFSITYFAS